MCLHVYIEMPDQSFSLSDHVIKVIPKRLQARASTFQLSWTVNHYHA
jgi:hypothetical protein